MHYANLYAAILRTRPPPELPYEVYTMILDQLVGQRRTLRSLAQVSRAMHTEAMPRLYSNIELDTVKKVDAFARAVDTAAEPHVVGARVHTFHLRVEFIATNRSFDQLERIISLLSNLVELRVRWRTTTSFVNSVGYGSHGALLVRCPTTSLRVFEWDCMYTPPVTDFLLLQPQLEELNVADGGMVSSRHKEFPPHALPNLSRIVGEARWLTQVAIGRPIVEATVTRNSIIGASELFRVLSLSRGPCRKLSFQGSVMSGIYPADVADLAKWLPHLHELGDCYLLDPFTLTPNAMLNALAPFDQLRHLRIITNGDWDARHFSIEDARKIHGSVPSLRRLTAVPQSGDQKAARVFVRHDKEIPGGRVKLYQYTWKEAKKPAAAS